MWRSSLFLMAVRFVGPRALGAGVGVVVLAGCGAPLPVVATGSAPARSPADGGYSAGAAADVAGTFFELPLEALPTGRLRFNVGGRNPFRFGPAGGVAAGPSAGAMAAPEVRIPAPATPVAAAGAVPPPPAGDDAGAVRYIGVVDVRGRPGPVAVLAAGRDVHHGRVNDVVQGRYRIVAIGARSIELEAVPGGFGMTLQLREAPPPTEESAP